MTTFRDILVEMGELHDRKNCENGSGKVWNTFPCNKRVIPVSQSCKFLLLLSVYGRSHCTGGISQSDP